MEHKEESPITSYDTKHIFSRAELLLGQPVMHRISVARVIIFGVGGVGSWCAESLIRSGIGHLTMVDGDVVVASNINRQLMATTATLGQPKVAVLRERLMQINPEADVRTVCGRFNTETAESFHLQDYDYVIDAIDSLPDKMLLINTVTRLPHTQLYSSMGAARKFDPTRIRIAEFWRVTGDPLARSLRQRFKRGKVFPARKFQCVYSDELLSNQQSALSYEQSEAGAPQPNGTVAHITAIFGNMLASLILKHICEKQ
ncbi:MAG: tRNA threonylcarbamoyladenosine dehydratase [Paludibacteraceae bacterium]|nr:tRNA threonylcarbamoyladenosine dehydratase [Paludibacteraceae bacterium]